MDLLSSPVQCRSQLRLHLFDFPAHQRFPGLQVGPRLRREQALAELGYCFHQLIKRWLVRRVGVITMGPGVRREGGKDGLRQSIQDESKGSRVDVLTNDSHLLHRLEKSPCRTRI